MSDTHLTFVNPYTMVHDALWTLALRHPDFAELVKPGNRVDYGGDTDRDPIKQVVADADLPEVALISEGITSANVHNTNTTTEVVRRYSFTVVTGDNRLRYRLYRVEWFLTCALSGWQEVFGALQWHGVPFVKYANVIGVNEGMSDSQRNRGIKGWSALWSCEVKLLFNTAHLREELTP